MIEQKFKGGIMTISAVDVKKLREESGAGFMDCKKALSKANGDIEQAKRILKEQGMAKAEKKSSRDASEGAVVLLIAEDKRSASIIEVNCETDFVARSDTFKAFTQTVANTVLSQKETDVTKLLSVESANGVTIEVARHEAVLQLGENIQIARAEYIQTPEGYICGYSHNDGLCVAVAISVDNEEVGRNIAMHVAASNPAAIKDTDIPQSLLEEEKSIYLKQLQDSKKPEDIVNKIVDGKMKKFAAGLCLYGQAYVKDPKQSVAEYLQSNGCDVHSMSRFALGESIA